jgi:uncharacterized protein YlxP (DUF503 family)
VSEVGGQATWQRSTLAVALTAGSLSAAQERADAVERHLLERFPDGAWVERTVRSFTEVDG